MSVRQDKVQISIAFITDESKAFAKLVEDNKKFIRDIQEAKNKGQDLAATIQKMAESGKAIANIPLDKLAPAQLILRAQQLKQVLSLIPQSAPEYKQLEAEYKKINDQLADMRVRTKGVAQAMHETRTEGGNFFNTLSGFAAKALIAFYALKTAATSLFKPSQLASEMENALISFETMLGSARNARKLVNEIVTLAASTPFETAELTDYVKRLLAMGIESKNVMGNIRQLGDIAAGVGKEKLPQIVLAFGQVATKTKLAGGELKQFSEAGVPLVAELAKVMGVAESKILDMTSEGKIGFKEVEQAIANMTSEGGKFAGLMGKQAQTTEGLMSTLKDNISLTLAAFGDGFNQALKDILRSSIAFTNGLDRDKIRAWGEAVGNAVKFLFEFGPALLRIISVYAAYRVTVLAADTAQNLFNRTLKINPFGLILSFGLAAVQMLIAYTNKLNAFTESQKAVAESTAAATHEIAEQRVKADALFGLIREGSASYDQQKDAMKLLLHTYPQHLGNIKTEDGLLRNLDEAQKRINAGILETTFSKIKAAAIDAKRIELIETEIEITRAQNDLQRAQLSNPSGKVKKSVYTREADGGFAPRTLVFDDPAIQDAQKRFKSATEKSKATLEFISSYSKNLDQTFVRISETMTNKSFFEGFDKFTAKINLLKEKLKINPEDKTLKNELEEVEKAFLKAQKEITASDAIKTKLVDPEDNSKEANKAAKSRLEILRAESQQRINEITLARLKEGKIESDFDTELLKEKATYLETKELPFLKERKKQFVGEYEKSSADLIKLQRQIREKQNAEQLNELEIATNARLTSINLERATGLINEKDANMRSLDITKGKFDEELKILESQGKRNTDDYAKVLLKRAEVENQIAETSLKNVLDVSKDKTIKLLQEEELRFEKGQVSEKQFKANALKIQLDGTNEEIGILEANGEKETALYRTLNIKKLQLIKQGQQAQTDAILETTEMMSDTEMKALSEALETKKITQNQYDLAILEDKESRFREQLQKLKENGLELTDEYAKIQAKLTTTEEQEAKKRAGIEQDEAQKRKQFFSELGNAFQDFLKDQLDAEIDNLSKTEEEKKKNAERIKKIRIQQVNIDTLSQVAKIWLHSMDLGAILGPILAGVLSVAAFARGENLKNKIQKSSYARGGFTGAGNRYVDETGHTPVGVVHNDEWVGPKWMTQNPQLRPMFNMMEQIRLRGYADGGFVNTTPTFNLNPSSITNAINVDMGALVSEFKGLRNDVRQWQTRLKAEVYRNELEAQADQDAVDRRSAAL